MSGVVYSVCVCRCVCVGVGATVGVAHAALLVEQVENARLALFALDQVDTRLVVVEVDERPRDLLLHVLLLLQLEHVLHIAHAHPNPIQLA